MMIVHFWLQVQPNSYWHEVIQNAWGCAIGSLAAIFVSVITVWVTIRSSKRSTYRLREIEERNQLTAFSIMLQNSISTISQQRVMIEKYRGELSLRPDMFPKIGALPLGNLQAIAQSITVEKTGLTYMKHFSGGNPGREFTTIIQKVDYFYTQYKQLGSLVERATINHDERRFKVYEVFLECQRLVNVIMLKYMDNYFGSSLSKLGEITRKFSPTGKRLERLGNLDSDFFTPIIDVIEPQLIVNRYNEDLSQLHFWAFKGREYSQHISDGYEHFHAEITALAKEDDRNFKDFTSAAKRLLESDYAKSDNATTST